MGKGKDTSHGARWSTISKIAEKHDDQTAQVSSSRCTRDSSAKKPLQQVSRKLEHQSARAESNDQPLDTDDTIFYESMEEQVSTLASASSSFPSFPFSTLNPNTLNPSRKLSEIFRHSLLTHSKKDPWYQRNDSREPEKANPTHVMQTVFFDQVSAAGTSKNSPSASTHKTEQRRSRTASTPDAKEAIVGGTPRSYDDIGSRLFCTRPDNEKSRSYDSISSRLSCAQPDSKKEDAKTASHTQVKIQVKPGVFMVLRSAVETLDAVEKGFASCVTCIGCKGKLKCVPDAEMVICSDCRVASPMETKEDKGRKFSRGSTSSVARRGVGLGLMV